MEYAGKEIVRAEQGRDELPALSLGYARLVSIRAPREGRDRCHAKWVTLVTSDGRFAADRKCGLKTIMSKNENEG